MTIPHFADVQLAQKQIRSYLLRTPLHSYPAIDSLIETKVFIKHENYQPIGSFKVRGGINLISQLSSAERQQGVIAASTGNHGQSVAYAARLFGAKAFIVVPVGANEGKVVSMKGMGAEVLFHGATFDEARLYCESLAHEEGYRYIHSGNEPLLIAGVATTVLEMLEDVPDLQVLIVPVGGGSGAAGACIVAKALNPSIRVIGVQSQLSPAAYESWLQRKLVEAANRTEAEGLATGVGFSLPQEIMWECLDKFVLISDEAMLRAMVWMIHRAHTLAEAAGAAPLAAAYSLRKELQGKKVGLICSGGNTSLNQLKRAVDLAQASPEELQAS
jgi:threonine dehydratase